MKRFFALCALLLLCGASAISEGARCMKFYACINQWDAGFRLFKEKHPELSFEWSEDYYANTSALAGKLLTRELKSDVMGFNSDIIDAAQLAGKGYLLDLSGSDILRDTLSGMHPAIAEACTRDGRLYGLPIRAMFSYWQTDEKGWAEAGLDIADAPDSFPRLLDFLDAWCLRVENEPEARVRVWSGWDETLYNESSYVELLTGLLLDSYIMQQEYAGQTLSFEDEALLMLLERAQATGKRLYEADPVISPLDGAPVYTLFSPISGFFWPKEGARIVSMRLNEAQPRLIRAFITLLSVYAGTDMPEACVELLQDIAQNLPAYERALLFKNARAVENPNYASDLARAEKNVADTLAKLKNAAPDERGELESDLAAYQNVLSSCQTEAYRYQLSPAQLSDYQERADDLYFILPSVFKPGTPLLQTRRELEKRFAGGQLTAADFLGELDRIARMARLEGA